MKTKNDLYRPAVPSSGHRIRLTKIFTNLSWPGRAMSPRLEIFRFGTVRLRLNISPTSSIPCNETQNTDLENYWLYARMGLVALAYSAPHSFSAWKLPPAPVYFSNLSSPTAKKSIATWVNMAELALVVNIIDSVKFTYQVAHFVYETIQSARNEDAEHQQIAGKPRRELLFLASFRSYFEKVQGAIAYDQALDEVSHPKNPAPILLDVYTAAHIVTISIDMALGHWASH